MRKSLIIIILVLLSFAITPTVEAEEFIFALPTSGETGSPTSGASVPGAPSGISVLYLVPGRNVGTESNLAGVTVIDKPRRYGEHWTMQLDWSNCSPYSIGIGQAEPSSISYFVVAWFSNYMTAVTGDVTNGSHTSGYGGSPFSIGPITWGTNNNTGNSTYAYPVTVPPTKYMWTTVDTGASAFWRFIVKFFTEE